MSSAPSSAGRRLSAAPNPGRSVQPLVLGVAYALLLLAWVASNPPGSSPDEPAHLTKALAAAAGDFRGEPARAPSDPRFGREQRPWVDRTSRLFTVSRRRTWDTVAPCNAFQPEVSSACLGPSLDQPRSGTRSVSYVGTYQPYLYAPIGAAAWLGGTPGRAVWAGRLVVAAIAAALLMAAALLVWDGAAGGLSLVGLMAAVTPMVVFLGSSLNPNGLEVAAGIGTLAAALHLARARPARLRLAWLIIGAGGAVLGLSRSTGPIWFALALVVGIALGGWEDAGHHFRQAPRLATAALLAAVIGVGLGVAWELAIQPRSDPSASTVVDNLLPSFVRLPEVMRQLIGVFGWLDVSQPAGAYLAWRLLLVVLMTLAFLAGGRRHRIVLVATLVAAVAVTVALSAVAVMPSGFAMQGRYVLPIVVAVPLLAGEVLVRRRRRIADLLPRRFPVAVAAIAAGVHGLAWFANGRRHAVGTRGPIWFLAAPQWSPPLGWWPWATLVAIAVTALLWTGRPAPRSA